MRRLPAAAAAAPDSGNRSSSLSLIRRVPSSASIAQERDRGARSRALAASSFLAFQARASSRLLLLSPVSGRAGRRGRASVGWRPLRRRRRASEACPGSAACWWWGAWPGAASPRPRRRRDVRRKFFGFTATRCVRSFVFDVACNFSLYSMIHSALLCKIDARVRASRLTPRASRPRALFSFVARERRERAAGIDVLRETVVRLGWYLYWKR